MNDPFHYGEKEIQKQTGQSKFAAMNGRLISDRIPGNANLFLAQQNYCVLGAVSPQGEIWASFLAGLGGFATPEQSGRILRLQLENQSGVLSKTPPFSWLQSGDHLGGLFIELSTRRRLRVNGRVETMADSHMVLEVGEAYPNCPKFIQKRDLLSQSLQKNKFVLEKGEKLSCELEAWVSSADSFFVASAHLDGRADVSYRGGKPGFIILQNNTLRIPDYPGNAMFGTLGNFHTNPHAGLTFVDFDKSRQLQITGEVRLDFRAGEVEGETAGTSRWWEFSPRGWIVSSLNKSLDWGVVEPSPLNP